MARMEAREAPPAIICDASAAVAGDLSGVNASMLILRYCGTNAQSRPCMMLIIYYVDHHE